MPVLFNVHDGNVACWDKLLRKANRYPLSSVEVEIEPKHPTEDSKETFQRKLGSSSGVPKDHTSLLVSNEFPKTSAVIHYDLLAQLVERSDITRKTDVIKGYSEGEASFTQYSCERS